jgi:hypothetical protein
MSIEDDFVLYHWGLIDVVINDSEESYSVLEFHRWLQDLIDSPEYMTFPNPSTRYTDHLISLENGYTITDPVAKRLRDGAIITQDGDYYSATGIAIRENEYRLPPMRKIRDGDS